jgi:hypothetical protein
VGCRNPGDRLEREAAADNRHLVIMGLMF